MRLVLFVLSSVFFAGVGLALWSELEPSFGTGRSGSSESERIGAEGIALDDSTDSERSNYPELQGLPSENTVDGIDPQALEPGQGDPFESAEPELAGFDRSVPEDQAQSDLAVEFEWINPNDASSQPQDISAEDVEVDDGKRLGLSSCSAEDQPQPGVTYIVNTATVPLNQRQEPSYTSQLVGSFEPGTTGLTFTTNCWINDADGLVWWEIDRDGTLGWVAGQYLTPN